MFKIDIKGTGLDLTPAIKEYIEEKIGHLEKFLPRTSETEIIARVEISRTTKHHQKGPVFRAEVNIPLGINLLRGEQDDWDIRVAIDGARTKLEQEIKKLNEKNRPQDSKGQKELRALRGK